MTNEQLNEIEKLARDPKSAAFHDLMADHTLPLVKALREALAIIDHYQRKDGPIFQAHLAEADAMRQRDEARAEVERMRDRMQLVADDIRHEASARRAELAAPRGGQSCGPRGGPLAGANPGVVQGVESWAKALEEALNPKGGA